jgi:XcyI restriction endonuclease
MLVAARRSVLADALSEALGQIDPNVVKHQILTYVPPAAQRILAAAGVRDEHVFPLPAILEKKPTLVGYYRLLLGISQKRFYRKGTGMGGFKSMETRGS